MSQNGKQKLKLMVEDCNCELLTHELEERTAELEHEKIETEVVLHSLGEAMYVVDKDYVVRMINPYAVELLGYTDPKELIGKSLDEVVPAVDEKGNTVPLVHRSNVRVLSGKVKQGDWSTSAYFVRKDGTKFPVQVTTTAISIDDERTGAISVFRDITRDVRLEQEKTEFIYLAAHQLRTPVSIIQLNLDLIAKHYKNVLEGSATSAAKEIVAGFAAMSEATRSLSELINTLLDISRVEMGGETVRETIDLKEIIECEIERQKLLAEQKQVSFAMHLDASVSNSIMSNKRLLQIILQNLISNAVKYNKTGGRVTIKTERIKGDMRISVSDQGIGIPRDAQNNIFKKFFRAENTVHSKQKGVGLGLYLVRAAAKELGGIIWFESELGAGTTFYLEIPA